MGKCKNTECKKETNNNNVYCSLTCRNYFVNKYIRDYSKNSESLSNNGLSKYNENIKYCKNDICGKKISYENRRNDYCNHSCAASSTNITRKRKKYTLSDDSLNNILLANKKKHIDKHIEYDLLNKLCLYCNNKLSFDKRKNKYCSNNCFNLHRKSNNKFLIYKQNTQFNFNLSDYPNEFDFSLIKQYGWYKPSNKGNNLGGVSRDHMLSVKDGFEQNIDPKIIGHPANCKLMIHTENISKNRNSSITLDELLIKINEWNLKYK